MPHATSPLSTNLTQDYADQLAKAKPPNDGAEPVSDIMKRADGIIALEIIQSLLPTAFPAVIQPQGASQTSSSPAATSLPPEAQSVPGGVIDLVG